MDRPLSLREAGGLAAVVAAALLVAVEALPPLAIADRLIEDIAIVRLAPPQPQASGIAVVAITEATLSTLPYRAPLDRSVLAGLIVRLRARQVRAIGLDVLIDQPTEAAKDAALLDALTAPGPPVVLVDAASATPLTQRQRQFLDGFLSGLRSGNGNLARDRLDGVVRQHFPFLDGKPSLPAALAQAVGVTPPAKPFTIAWIRTGKPDLPAIPVYPVETLSLLPTTWLADKIVLVG
ncbi:MAG TPA: CHASE2 domain-containing protein, partial [Patescibacteria group bacterium]|nr:CHASE2 domain-containing protein [Patescibacteria group bacterium]